MKLSADEMFEITAALQYGLKKADFSAMSNPERSKWLAAVRANAERRFADPTLTESERLAIRERMELADKPDTLAKRDQERYYSRSASERSRNLADRKMAMNDLLSQSHYFSELQRAAIDAELRSRGLPTLRKLEIALKRRHDRILKRGKIRNEEEYYIVKEVLSDASFDIAASDRMQFEQMASAFEGIATP